MQINTNHYKFSHGKDPKGSGTWLFSYNTINPEVNDVIWVNGRYSQALKEAKKEGKRRQAFIIYVLP